MLTNKRIVTASYIAQGEAAPHRLVAYGDADDHAAPAVGAAGEKLLGATTDTGATDGGRVDVVLLGPTPVLYGAAVTRGDRIKADAQGRAVPAAAGEASIGEALLSGVVGDIGAVFIGR
ncbi:hypothetical protein QMA69_05995 [Burkholderia pseudomallei]|uniref:hypothetical protein n=1 Tax=pseudomallei group TaxID=111527 RepID=UPI00016ADF7B|nr:MULTISPECIES: hypothetical protein [pseudomallei group]AJX84125.1 putative gp30 [Burkholderia pseudomallei 7894]ARK71269.1 hypothetical protein BOC38_32990 [Burkholderia pseudomallei]ARK77798.1 hypothetical protein BOC39_31430 [Burkholderia pseudomallei]ARL19263.1 hypothetical protein BOC46_28330 [Burkholderia pseudomallei]ARL25635.1 hypothetical protein BOC47_25100 [Burkholderia pseudomallei]